MLNQSVTVEQTKAKATLPITEGAQGKNSQLFGSGANASSRFRRRDIRHEINGAVTRRRKSVETTSLPIRHQIHLMAAMGKFLSAGFPWRPFFYTNRREISFLKRARAETMGAEWILILTGMAGVRTARSGSWFPHFWLEPCCLVGEPEGGIGQQSAESGASLVQVFFCRTVHFGAFPFLSVHAGFS